MKYRLSATSKHPANTNRIVQWKTGFNDKIVLVNGHQAGEITINTDQCLIIIILINMNNKTGSNSLFFQQSNKNDLLLNFVLVITFHTNNYRYSSC